MGLGAGRVERVWNAGFLSGQFLPPLPAATKWNSALHPLGNGCVTTRAGSSQTHQRMNRAIHGLITATFAFGCWCLWALLTLDLRFVEGVFAGAQLPPFTRLCLGLRPLLVVLPILAAAYCALVCFRRKSADHTWTGFFAAAITVLLLATLLVIIALWLPLTEVILRLGSRQS